MTDAMDRPVQRSGLRAKSIVWGLGLLAVLLLLVGLVVISGGAKRTLRVSSGALTVDSVQRGTFRDFIPLNAKIVPFDVIYLDALEGGQVEKVLVRAGDSVALGQPLLTFRNTALELEVLDREGRLIESITQLQTYEKTLEQNRADNEKALALINYDILRLSRATERRDKLAAKGYLPLEQRDQVRDELAYSQRLQLLQLDTNRKQEGLRLSQIPKIRAELGGLQQSLKITRSKLESLVVKAPVAGRLTAIDLKIGENRNRGDRLAEITPDTGFKASADIDEFYLGRLHPGQAANVVIDGAPRTLRVSRVYPQVNNGRFVVDLEFVGDMPSQVLSGQAVQGKLALGGDAPALVLPAGPFLEKTGGAWVFVVSGTGREAVRRAIKVGRRNADQVEVLSGVRANEQVITSDYTGFEGVDRIKIGK